MNRGFTPIEKGEIKMGTKGASNRYGNTTGGKQGKATEHINFSWAKDFNKHSLVEHYNEHGNKNEFGSIESYKQHAIRFANNVDRKNYKSFVDRNTGKTYKYSPKTNELVVVDKHGYIVTYFKPKKGYGYYIKQKYIIRK